MKEKSFVSIVFYMRNYQNYVEPFIDKIIPLFNDNFEHFEVICVNNNSTDDSVSILKDAYNKYNYDVPLNIVTLSRCTSIDEALSAGIELAIGDFIYSFNSVLIDYDLSMITQAFKESLNGNDAVVVSPNKKTTFIQKMYYCLYNFGVNKDSKIHPEKFKILSRRVINRIGNMSNYSYSNMSSLNACGLQIETVFYVPSKLIIKYDKEEKNERIHKALESLILHTNTFQYLILMVSLSLLIVSVILFATRLYIYSTLVFICGLLMLSVTAIISFIHIQTKLILVNDTYLIKSVDKVVK